MEESNVIYQVGPRLTTTKETQFLSSLDLFIQIVIDKFAPSDLQGSFQFSCSAWSTA